MYDIFYLGAFDENWHAIKSKFPNAQLINKDIDVLSLQKRAFTKMFWVIWDDVYINKFDLSKYRATKWDDNYVHVFLNGNNFKDGICLLNKTNISNKEFKNRFFINKKDIDIVASVPRPFEKIFISTYDDYLEAIDQCKTDMFWAIWDDVEVDPDFKFDYYVPRYDTFHRNITHIFKNGEFQDGICLFSKNTKITKKEFDHRFFINKKEIDIVASRPKRFQKHTLKTYDDYLEAIDQCKTDMFWVVWDDVEVDPDFKFDYYVPRYDTFHRNITHIFKNGEFKDGICLFSKNTKITKKEFEHRFFIEKKEVDIIASHPKKFQRYSLKTYDDYLQATVESETDMFWVVWNDVEVDPNFHFDYYVPVYDTFHRNITHIFKNGEFKDGICLFSKNTKITKKEFEHRFFIEKKEVDIIASTPRRFDRFYIETFEQYQHALESSATEMFWALSHNLSIDENFDFNFYFSHHNTYDRNQNHAFVHRISDKDLYNGIFLLSKNKILSKKEIEFRFLVERKEWPIVASGPVKYDRFVIDNYKDYLKAYDDAKTEMIWIIPKEVQIKKGFDFNIYFSHDNQYDRSMHHGFKHIFRNQETYNGITLVSKKHRLSKKEIDFRFVIEKKEWDIVASHLKPYDIIFISYNESNADDNFKNLQQRFPRAKRIHGVKGIHQAHIKAAELSDTDMFFVVDGDAVIEDVFHFDYEVPVYDKDCVHVWRSRNPINDLEYGYGGVKLLPRQLTLNMDVNAPDMTTSISKKFKIQTQVSNISKFDIDEFSTWRSAFRECAKLASKTIQGQIDEETNQRLEIWTTIGSDRKYGNYAIAGARAGREFGNTAGVDLKLINDFDWLYKKFIELQI